MTERPILFGHPMSRSRNGASFRLRVPGGHLYIDRRDDDYEPFASAWIARLWVRGAGCAVVADESTPQLTAKQAEKWLRALYRDLKKEGE